MNDNCLACKNEQQHSEVYKQCHSCISDKVGGLSVEVITMCTSMKCPLRSSCVRFSYKEDDYRDMPHKDFFKELNGSKLCPLYIGRILYED